MIKKNFTKIKLYILIIAVLAITTGAFVLFKNESSKSEIYIATTKAKENKDTMVEQVDLTPDTLNVMGFSEIDYLKAISFILTKGSESPYGIDAIDFNGLTIDEHLANLNAAAYCEDINPVVMLCQQISETGIYMYKCKVPDKNGNLVDKFSVVKPSDYNFCGLGATDNDGRTNVNIFLSNAEGQLAQAQHLKAYASTSDVNTLLVDTRFKYVQKRGSATTVSELSGVWASNTAYGEHITNLYNEYLNHEPNIDLVKEYSNKTF